MKTVTRWEVATMMGSSAENCWTNDAGEPVTFPSATEAERYLVDYLADIQLAVNSGEMDSGYEIYDFVIRPVQVPMETCPECERVECLCHYYGEAIDAAIRYYDQF
jgi:hypothetical protein